MRRLWRVPAMFVWVLWNVVKSSVDIGRATLVPGPVGSPVLVRYPMRCRTEIEVTTLVWAITVTPGTLVAVIGDTDLWVHVVLGGGREQMCELIAETEDKVLWALADPTSPEEAR